MNNKIDYRFLNFIIKLLGLSLAVAAIFAVSKYIGLLAIITKVIKSLFPVFIAIVLSFLTEPLIRIFEKRRIKRRYAVLLSYGLELGVVILIIVLIFPQLFAQLNIFFTNLPTVLSQLEGNIKNILGDFGVDFNITGSNNAYLTSIFNGALNLLSTTLSTLLNISIAFGGALFLSFDFIKFKESVKKIIPKKYKKEVLDFFKEFLPFVHKYCFGIMIDACILWVLVGVSLQVVGMNYAFMFGFIVAICDLIPIVGPYIGGAPAVIVAMTISWEFTLIVLIIIIVAQIIESNITQPFILKNVISLHPLEGIAGIAILGALFGFFGLIASPIVVTAFKIIVKQHYKRRNSTKEITN